MKNIVLFVVFIAGIVLVQFAQGQTADDIINKYVDARGGKEKLLAIQSVYMEGSRQMMGNEIPVKVTIVNGKLFRTDFEFSGSSFYSIVTPTAGWNLTPRSPNVESTPADRLKTMQGPLDIPGALVNYAIKGNKVELLPKSTLNGVEVNNIKLTQADGKPTNYSFDTKSGLLIETRSTAMGQAMGGKPIEREVITDYSDYKDVGGVQFPHTMANPGTGQMGGSTTFDKIELNKVVDENMYKPAK